METKIIARLRALSLDMINGAGNGHIGMALGATEIFYTLLAKELNFSQIQPGHQKWINRDRFVLSAGHGSAGIYSVYRFLGLLSDEDIRNHKQFGSKTPSHPEIDKFDYVDASTGPLGQGLAMAIGMAYAEKFVANKFNKTDLQIIDHFVYALCGDGDFQEGVGLEALAFAGTNKLDNLIVIHDYNEVQIDSRSSVVNNVDFAKYFESIGFRPIILKGNSVAEISKAIAEAKLANFPVYIQVPTTIAYGTNVADKPVGHHGFLNIEQTIEYKRKLGLTDTTPFFAEQEFLEQGQKIMAQKHDKYQQWVAKLEAYKQQYKTDFSKLEELIEGKVEYQISDFEFTISNVATRNYVGQIFSQLDHFDFLIGGSADLVAATKVKLRPDKNIVYGIREFAMTAINNGIMLYSKAFRAVSSTFLTFADYAKSAIRMAALMKLPALFVYSHDSYQVGGDGPTHQPVDQIGMLRLVPNLNVIRPCDESEMLTAFKFALAKQDEPTAIISTRQYIKSFNLAPKNFKAAYLISDNQNFDISLLASGSEVQLAFELAKKLYESQGVVANVISVPYLQGLVDNQDLITELKIDQKPAFAIEATNDSLWYKLARFTRFEAHLAANFGESAPGDVVYERQGFSIPNLSGKIKEFLIKKL